MSPATASDRPARPVRVAVRALLLHQNRLLRSGRLNNHKPRTIVCRQR